jgi:hypothetical protein
MTKILAGLIAAALSVAPSEARTPAASGVVGIYAIVEKVVLEPNDSLPTRIVVHGAFSFVDYGMARIPLGSAVASMTGPTTQAKRGRMYFMLSGMTRDDIVRKEWADLKAVAGTGDAVGFGAYGYLGMFDGGSFNVSRVRAESEPLGPPIAYLSNAGVVKLPDHGVHAQTVRMLRAALPK